ncbi:MAG: hypothetical protein WBA29_03175, partial [Xanthobacteraceae bacterium]
RTHRCNIAHPRRKHRCRKCCIWIGARQCSSLYPAGPKYPSGQTPPPVIEIDVNGMTVRADAAVDEAHLLRVLRAVRSA